MGKRDLAICGRRLDGYRQGDADESLAAAQIDALGVDNRRQARSKYGAKRPKG